MPRSALPERLHVAAMPWSQRAGGRAPSERPTEHEEWGSCQERWRARRRLAAAIGVHLVRSAAEGCNRVVLSGKLDVFTL
eukprot:6800364-Alexandrium_andersonii.AAC.1